MKTNIKLNKILSNILAFIMLSSTMYIPQNLVLAQQLSQIKIVDDNTEGVNEDTSKEEAQTKIHLKKKAQMKIHLKKKAQTKIYLKKKM